jgi:phage gp36-like protein
MKNYLYEENVDVITRSDDTLVTSAIDTAVSEAKGYLSNYDKDTIFAQTSSSRNQLLLTMCKDLAAFHLVKLSAAGVNYEYRKQVYDRAVTWLKDVMKGNIVPDLPTLETTDGVEYTAQIRYGSNAKKSQHF